MKDSFSSKQIGLLSSAKKFCIEVPNFSGIANMGLGGALFGVFLLSVLVGDALAGTDQKQGILATIWKWMPLMFQGFMLNILVSVLSMSIGTVAGAFLGLAQVSLYAPVRKIGWIVMQFFRNAPWLVLVFFTISIIPFQFPIAGHVIPFPGWLKATIGLSLPVMANTAEIFRGGIQSIPLAQWESAESLAFSRTQTLLMIIVPQCVKRMLPPWMNLYAILTTATPLISLVGVDDALSLTRSALMAEGRSELLIPMYAILLIWFFLYCYPIAVWTVRLERRFAVKI